MRCLLSIPRWVWFVTSHNPFLCCCDSETFIEFSTELMPISLCEIGKIELEGGYICKPEDCSEIRFCSVISRVVDTCQWRGGGVGKTRMGANKRRSWTELYSTNIEAVRRIDANSREKRGGKGLERKAKLCGLYIYGQYYRLWGCSQMPSCHYGKLLLTLSLWGLLW